MAGGLSPAGLWRELMREIILSTIVVTLLGTLLLVLYDRATTPTCTVQEDTIYMPKDWLVDPPNFRIKP